MYYKINVKTISYLFAICNNVVINSAMFCDESLFLSMAVFNNLHDFSE